MIRSNEKEAYVSEVLRRYDDFRAWTIAHWPNQDNPLDSGDFSAGRKELAVLLDARLYGGVTKPPPPDAAGGGTDDPDAGQFLPVTPAPWP